MNNAPPVSPTRNNATTRLNANVLEPITIVRMRVHDTCVLIVTNPDASAAKYQNVFLSVSVVTAGSTAAGSIDCRCKLIAITPTTRLIAAAMMIVVRTPNDGSNTNPAASVPTIAPTRLHAYNRVTAVEPRCTSAADNTGNVAPINVVGASNIKQDNTNRHRLNAKNPG